MIGKTTILFFLSLFAFSSPLSAQDANYWTQQYGAYSALLGGAVIGSTRDLSATYYNPGRLMLADSSVFIVSAKAYQYASLRIENAAGEGVDAVDRSIAGSPDLVAGNLPVRRFLGECRMAYSILHRYSGDFDITVRGGNTLDALPNLPGEETFAGELQFNYKVSDFWAGVAWGTTFGANKNIGFGVTPYISIRSHRWNRRIIYEALLAETTTASALRFNEFRYNSYNLLFKFGLSANLGRSNIGLNLTTPYLKILGQGDLLYNELITGGDLDGDGLSDDLMAANQQVKQKARFRSPWSIGIGGSFPTGKKGRLHLSAEWFSSVQAYDLVDNQPFTGQSNGETYTHSAQTRAQSVINAGAGFEIFANDKMQYYANFTTDFSPAPEAVTESVTARLGTNYYHLGGGTVLKLGKIDLNLGLVYSFGNAEIPQFWSIFFPPGWEIGDENEKGMLHARRLKLIFGITVN